MFLQGKRWCSTKSKSFEYSSLCKNIHVKHRRYNTVKLRMGGKGIESIKEYKLRRTNLSMLEKVNVAFAFDSISKSNERFEPVEREKFTNAISSKRR